MKKLLSFIALTLMGHSMMAKPVEPEKAVQVAKNFMAQYVKGADKMEATVSYTHPMSKSGQPAMYVVNLGSAFVIVSADDVAHPVLGYSTGRAWPTKQALPSQVTAYLDDLAAQIEAATTKFSTPNSQFSIEETSAEWQQLLSINSNLLTTPNLPDSVGPLLTTTWDQGQYYNALCPEDANGPAGHCVTGCVATAMAQIINYWGYPIHGRGTHSYQHDTYGTLTVNYDSAIYDYAHMPDAITSTSTLQEVNAVATLMRDCGVAVSMFYGPYESGADGTVIASALVDYFRMNPRLGETSSSYYTGEQWTDLLRNNISRNQPVLYSNVSHEYILDGYNTGGYFHFNMGWGGYADGWYLLDTFYNYTAIVDIRPDSSSNIIIGQSYGTSSYFVDSIIHFKHVYAESDYPHSVYTGGAHPQIITFQLQDTSEQIVVDFISYDEETPSLIMEFYDGGDTSSQLIRTLNMYGTIDISPIVASSNKITIYYTCVHADAGFHLRIGGNENCRVVSNVVVNESTETKEITWTENGSATQWMVEYGETGFTEGAVFSTIVDTAYVVISGLSPDTTYDVRIRPVCSENATDIWRCITVNNRKYWTDVVFSEPEGYYIDSVETIHISSAEGLAWMAKQRTNDWQGYEYSHHNIIFDNDIDLGMFLWRPIPQWFGNVDGQGHSILNMKVKEISNNYEGGLFGSIEGDSVKNIGFVNANIDSPNSGPLAARSGISLILNCFSINHTVKSSQFHAGGLIGESSATLINCFAIGSINPAFDGGGIVADGAPKMYNCYSSVREISGLNVWKGLFTAYTRGGEFDNCFADIDYVEDNWSGTYLGTLYDNPTMGYFFGHTEDIRSVRNVSAFSRNVAGNALLVIDTSINCSYPNGTTLLDALNGWVNEKNDPAYRVWMVDSVSGLPVLGNLFEPLCPNVSEITLENVKTQEGYAVVISWQENGTSDEWQIKCIPFNDTTLSIVMINSSATSDTLFGMQLGSAYNFYVRSVCQIDSVERWGNPVEFVVDKPYWTDIVTSQPTGYLVDSTGTITITSAEGLAWLSVCSNGLNGQAKDNYYNKRVKLIADVDLGEYKWKPISLSGNNYDEVFQGSFNGYGHIISNLYINEKDALRSGLFGSTRNASIQSVSIVNCQVIGYYDVGSLIGESIDSKIDNCHSNGTIKGSQNVGGLVGIVNGVGYGGYIVNSSAQGEVYGNRMTGGLVGFQTLVVRNCFSNCNIHKGIGSGDEWNGGLFGGCAGNVENIYCLGQVDTLLYMYGNITSANVIFELYPDVVVKNIYSLTRDNGLSFFGDDTWGSHTIMDTSTFVSSGSLITNVTISGNTYSDLLSALNAWVDANDTVGIYRHWAADTANINGGFPVFAAPQLFTLTLNVDENTPFGSVSGGGSFSELNREATIIAFPQEHYHFVQWNDGNRENPRTVVLTQDTSFTAIFGIDMHSVVGTANSGISYVNNFENPVQDNQWIFINDNYVNQWYIATLDDTNRALFISNDNGVSNNYTISNANSYVFAYTDLSLDAGQYNYSYDWRCNAEQSFDYLRAALLSTTTALNTSEWSYNALPTGSIALDGGSQLVQQSYWTTQSGVVDVPSDGEYKLVFYWHNDGSVGNMPPAAIDNVQFSSTVIVEGHGVVLGSDTVPYLDTVTLTAIPDEGYHFMQWNDGNTNNPRIVIATENVRYVALFEIDIPIGSDSITVCDSYLWNGTVYTADTMLVDTLSTIDGDSISFHHIFVNHSNTGDTTATACDSFTWWSANFTNSTNEATHVYTNDAGCDSIVMLHLTINYSTSSILTDTACEAYFWNGEWRYSSGQYSDTLTNAAGCDSIATLNLTINNPVHTATTATACDSYTWQEAVITTSGTYHYTHTDANGCTQDDTLYLTINYSTTGDTTATACDSFTWWNTTYTNSTNTPTHIYTNAAGCDSTVTLHLTINHSTSSIVTDTACEAYFWNGEWRYISGQYSDTLTNITGCDSIVTLTLTINNPFHTATTVTACDSYTWQEAVITTSGTYHYTHTDVNGCTQDDTLYLTINHNDTVIVDEVVCDSLTWYGTTYTASAYGIQYLTVPNTVGCDSIFFLDLTVNYTTYGEMSAVSCDSYQWDWNSAIYTASGDYTYRDTVNQNSQFCDSVLTLHLTINHSATSDTTATACDLFLWYGNMGYDVSGDYEHQWWNVTADGCDSILTLHLTINYSTETTVTDTAEGSYTWNGTTYTESGTYTWNGTTAEGCDSTVTLLLTITPTQAITQSSIQAIKIYPNPTSDLLTIDADDILSVELFDLNGRLVFSSEVDSSPFTFRLSPFTLNAGSYLLRIHTRQGTAVQHVILN